MNHSKIESFFKENSQENIRFYLSFLIEKIRSLQKMRNFIGLLLILLFFLYYIAEENKNITISIGPIMIENMKDAQAFIPLSFSFLILQYIVISYESSKLYIVMKYASHLFFSYEESEDDSIYRQTNNFTKTIIPFNIYEELNLLATPKSSRYPYIGNLMLVGAPLLLVIIACFGFQFKLITDLFLNHENLNSFARFCAGFSSILILLQVFFFISTTLNNFLNKDGS